MLFSFHSETKQATEREWGSNLSSPEKGHNVPSGVQSALNSLEEVDDAGGE